MKKNLHKLYLVTQTLILTAGAALFVWVVYNNFYQLTSGAQDSARNCAFRAISKDIPLGLVGTYSDQWSKLVRGHIILKGNYAAMRAESERITKACSDSLAVEVSEESGEVTLYIMTERGYESAIDSEQLLYTLGLILGGTVLLSILLFATRKWLGLIFS